MAEVGGLRAGRDDQAVVVQAFTPVEHHLASVGIDVRDLGHEHVHVGAVPERRPERLRALARGDRTSRQLVEQGLEEMVIRPVDRYHVDVGVLQLLRGGQPAEAAADDDDAAAAHAVYSATRSAKMIRAAAWMSARWEKACGKLPRCRPVLVSNSSA